MKNPKRASLIVVHAERIPAKVVENAFFLKAFREALGRRTGVCILYKRNSVFYVGLAGSLRKRLADHTRDHLRGRWDEFSFFVTRKEKYLKDIESLLIRATRSEENRNTPDFASHRNIRRELERVAARAAKFD